MKRLVIYHGNCYDGITAAYVCWLMFKDEAEYIPFNYSDPAPQVEGYDVVIVDFSFKRDVILKMREQANTLLILDHHKTAQKELEGLEYAIFDMERSGAGLAWDYYFGDQPIAFTSQNRPILVDYIEDRDLWKFKRTNSKEINALFQSYDIDLKTWIGEVSKLDDRPFDQLVSEGTAILRKQDSLVKAICANAKLAFVGKENFKYQLPYVQTSVLMSEVCDQMIKNFPDFPGSFYSFERKDGKIQYGLRSRGDFDVSVIAKQYGGGGHKNAAGFELDKGIEL